MTSYVDRANAVAEPDFRAVCLVAFKQVARDVMGEADQTGGDAIKRYELAGRLIDETSTNGQLANVCAWYIATSPNVPDPLTATDSDILFTATAGFNDMAHVNAGDLA